jgi:transcriptional regulator with XRE-family HTH domain
MADRSEVLHQIMKETGTSQSQLARLSGVHQPSISQFLSARVDLSDEQLDRLLSCMGYRLEVSRHAITPELTRAEWRSWKLHRQLSTQLTRSSLTRWRPTILANLNRLHMGVRGQPHLRNIERWEALVNHGDVAGLHRVLTGLDRDYIEMREVSPMTGLLADEERTTALEALD